MAGFVIDCSILIIFYKVDVACSVAVVGIDVFVVVGIDVLVVVEVDVRVVVGRAMVVVITDDDAVVVVEGVVVALVVLVVAVAVVVCPMWQPRLSPNLAISSLNCLLIRCRYSLKKSLQSSSACEEPVCVHASSSMSSNIIGCKQAYSTYCSS